MNKRNRRTKRCFRVFFAWQEDAEASWLEQMALEGWSLVSVRGIRYTFVESDPQRIAYRLDYQVVSPEGYEEYRQISSDMGWECVARLGHWVYLRRPEGQEDAAELYTDNASRLQRYRSQLKVMALTFAPLTYTLVVHPLTFGPWQSWWGRSFQIATLLLAVVGLYAMGRIRGIIRRLETSPRE